LRLRVHRGKQDVRQDVFGDAAAIARRMADDSDEENGGEHA